MEPPPRGTLSLISFDARRVCGGGGDVVRTTNCELRTARPFFAFLFVVFSSFLVVPRLHGRFYLSSFSVSLCLKSVRKLSLSKLSLSLNPHQQRNSLNSQHNKQGPHPPRGLSPPQ